MFWYFMQENDRIHPTDLPVTALKEAFVYTSII
jgi:hypothetical protein